ncbi:permease [Megasphaera vaginalis (ex Bordigoni et al. 2020)]|uniref:permease n=1 Tax=Megasphaera vaginalis (ex Bordigoni et al. 2020) TaxID=2045301 RepID=UPI000C7A69CF|nr:permease [Megasphaera vaginalis (ex Bordigoni et al. 2020)]
MKRIPVYIVTGFLSTGKTRFINHVLPWRETTAGVVLMEEGMTAPACDHVLTVPLAADGNIRGIAYLLRRYLREHPVGELWVEWNGMVPFRLAEALFFHRDLRNLIEIKTVFFVTTAAFCLHRLGKTGTAVVSQLRNADKVVMFEPPALTEGETVHAAGHIVKTLRPDIGITCFGELSSAQRTNRLCRPVRKTSLVRFFVLFLCLAGLYGFFATAGDPDYDSLNTVLTYSMATLLQGLPFLVLGILCSSALQLFLSASFIETFLRGNLLQGMVSALVGAVLFPVCDCAAIPVFRGLVSRKVPVPTAMLFMLAGPLLNPIVILSTYYAFMGVNSVVLARLVLGTVAAVTVSLSFLGYKGLEREDFRQQVPLEFCGFDATSGAPYGKGMQFLLHARSDFFRMAPYLLIGTVLSSLFQVYGEGAFFLYDLQEHVPVAIVLLLALAFLLSLCSTSDAMIARNLSTRVPLPAVMGFLIMGPMLDVKNFLILSALFPKAFVYRLTATIIFVSFVMAWLYALLWGGGSL